MSQTALQDPYTDVVELCALLQCLGFSVKSLDCVSGNVSQEGGNRTVTINCQASGFHVVLESANLSCSCPTPGDQQTGGFWQVSGVTGGKQYSKECGSATLRSLPKAHQERLTRELQEIVRCIKEHNDNDVKKEVSPNKSASCLELKTPEKKLMELKNETPTRYRSLDTLTGAKADIEELPKPGALQKLVSIANVVDKMQTMCKRQGTYTLSEDSDGHRRRNKTSSPIQNTFVEEMCALEKMMQEVVTKMSNIKKVYMEEDKPDLSTSSLALDVSKISVVKGAEISKPQFSSSPNLSRLGVNDGIKKKLARNESASTSNLSTKSAKEAKSRLPRLSPNIFKKSVSVNKDAKGRSSLDSKNKLNSLFKPKILTATGILKSDDTSPSASATKRRILNIKSTIPKATKNPSVTKKEQNKP